MKVTRKVGRRHSFVSLRKHGKRSHGHKRARTYKHRKMFHKGGKKMPLFGNPPPVNFDWNGDEGHGIIFNLRYTDGNKNKYDTFDIKMTEGRNFTFTKIGGKSKFSFAFKAETEDVLINYVVSAIKFGDYFPDSANYKFIADENLAIRLRDSIKGIRTY
jgi:hypothetical protein